MITFQEVYKQSPCFVQVNDSYFFCTQSRDGIAELNMYWDCLKIYPLSNGMFIHSKQRLSDNEWANARIVTIEQIPDELIRKNTYYNDSCKKEWERRQSAEEVQTDIDRLKKQLDHFEEKSQTFWQDTTPYQEMLKTIKHNIHWQEKSQNGDLLNWIAQVKKDIAVKNELLKSKTFKAPKNP